MDSAFTKFFFLCDSCESRDFPAVFECSIRPSNELSLVLKHPPPTSSSPLSMFLSLYPRHVLLRLSTWTHYFVNNNNTFNIIKYCRFYCSSILWNQRHLTKCLVRRMRGCSWGARTAWWRHRARACQRSFVFDRWRLRLSMFHCLLTNRWVKMNWRCFAKRVRKKETKERALTLPLFLLLHDHDPFSWTWCLSWPKH